MEILGIVKTKFQVDEYTRLEEEETLIGNGTVFFANQLNFWGQTTLVLGLLKLEISLSFDKKYFGIIQGFQRQRSMIYYLQVDDDLLTFSYFHFLYI